MSMTFTKLFSSITESTVWCEDSDTRVVWITMLAMSDRHGRVWGSVPGLAKNAVVSLEACIKALDKFTSPDKWSRTKEYEGRRIEEIPGGWRLLNHGKFRDMRDEEERKIYKADWIRNKRADVDRDVDSVDKSRPQSTYTDTDTDTDTDKKPIGRKRAPKGFVLSDTAITFAGEQGMSKEEIKDEFDSFKDCEFKSARKDWDAAWRTWCRNWKKWGKNEKAKRSHTESFDEKLERNRVRAGL